MEDTIAMMEKLKKLYGHKVEIAYALNTPFPGTYQYEHLEELGMELTVGTLVELDMVGPVIRTKNFNEDDLKHYNSRAMKVFYSGGNS